MLLQPEIIMKNSAVYEFLKSRDVYVWNTCVTCEPEMLEDGREEKGRKWTEPCQNGSQLHTVAASQGW